MYKIYPHFHMWENFLALKGALTRILKKKQNTNKTTIDQSTNVLRLSKAQFELKCLQGKLLKAQFSKIFRILFLGS